MKKEFLPKVIPVLSLLLALVCTACSGKESGNPEKLLLSLNFDEGSGNQVSDGAGQAQPAEVKYLFTNAAYMDARSPEWRSLNCTQDYGQQEKWRPRLVDRLKSKDVP